MKILFSEIYTIKTITNDRMDDRHLGIPKDHHEYFLVLKNSFILTDFKNAKLTSFYIFQKAVECKLLLLRLYCHELSASATT